MNFAKNGFVISILFVYILIKSIYYVESMNSDNCNNTLKEAFGGHKSARNCTIFMFDCLDLIESKQIVQQLNCEKRNAIISIKNKIESNNEDFISEEDRIIYEFYTTLCKNYNKNAILLPKDYCNWLANKTMEDRLNPRTLQSLFNDEIYSDCLKNIADTFNNGVVQDWTKLEIFNILFSNTYNKPIKIKQFAYTYLRTIVWEFMRFINPRSSSTTIVQFCRSRCQVNIPDKDPEYNYDSNEAMEQQLDIQL